MTPHLSSEDNKQQLIVTTIQYKIKILVSRLNQYHSYSRLQTLHIRILISHHNVKEKKL